MEINIDYHEKMAYITGAIKDGQEYGMKYLKNCLQRKAKADGYYGLEFWHFAEYKHGYDRDNKRWQPGEFWFEILDPYMRLG